MGGKVQYRQVVRSPTAAVMKQFLLLAGLITVCLPLLLRLLLTPPPGMQLASWVGMIRQYTLHPPLVVLVPMWLALWLLLWMGNRVRISLRGGVLHLPPEGRYHPRRIPVGRIVLFREKPYPREPAADFPLPEGVNTVVHQVAWLAGYRGPGVQIGFLRARKNPSNLKTLMMEARPELDHELVTVHFPCARPAELAAALREVQPACSGQSSGSAFFNAFEREKKNTA